MTSIHTQNESLAVITPSVNSSNLGARSQGAKGSLTSKVRYPSSPEGSGDHNPTSDPGFSRRRLLDNTRLVSCS